MLGDNQNTVRDLATYNGSVTTIVDHLVYTAFGQPLSTLSNGFQFGYTGSYFDTATGLQWSTDGWYNSQLQRWMTQAPLGVGLDSNQYRYYGNSATNVACLNGTYDSEVVQSYYNDASYSVISLDTAIAFMTAQGTIGGSAGASGGSSWSPEASGCTGNQLGLANGGGTVSELGLAGGCGGAGAGTILVADKPPCAAPGTHYFPDAADAEYALHGDESGSCGVA